VRGDGQPGRAPGEGRVDLLDVAQVLVLGVVAALGQLLPLGRVVEVGQAGVVQLQVLAAEPGQRRDLGGIGGREVGPEWSAWP
jgi:hypothetical protein